MLLLAKDYCESRRLESGTNITLLWIFFTMGLFLARRFLIMTPLIKANLKKYYIKKELARLEGTVLGEQPQSCLLDTKAPPSFRVAVIYLWMHFGWDIEKSPIRLGSFLTNNSTILICSQCVWSLIRWNFSPPDVSPRLINKLINTFFSSLLHRRWMYLCIYSAKKEAYSGILQ